jgi:hypothetical protein
VHPGAEDTGTPAHGAPPPGAEDATPWRTEHPTPAHGAPPDTDHSDQRQTKVRSTPDEPTRADVERVCRHLADRIEANGSKRPTVTKPWRDAARRLIDRDGRTVEQILRAIDWCQDDPFWRANILSMPKLREKYDQLRLQARRARASPGTDLELVHAAPRPSTTDQRVSAALALAAQFDAQEAL